MATRTTEAFSASSPPLRSHHQRTSDPRSARRLPLVIVSNGVLRVAGGASSVLVGVYLADLASHGMNVGSGLAGTLAAISFGTELLGAVPLGLLSDAVPVRTLMTGGAMLAALATFLFGITHETGVFVISVASRGSLPPRVFRHCSRTSRMRRRAITRCARGR